MTTTKEPIRQSICPIDGSRREKFQALVESLQSESGSPAAMATRMLRRGQHLYRAGGVLKHVYSIRQGTLKTYRIGTDGRERICGFHFAGELLGLDALTHRAMRCAAIALDTCVICQVPLLTIRQATDRSGELGYHVLEQLDNEIVRLENRLAVWSLPAPQRLAGFILSMANPSGEACLPMSHRDLGNYLRLVPETVSRLLTKFHQRGWLAKQDRGLVICDRHALEQVAGGLIPH